MKQEYDLSWDVEAGKILKKIYRYIKKNYSEESAIKLRTEIVEKVRELKLQPEKHPPEPLLAHRKENFRFIIVKSYKVIYEFTSQEVRILFIYNTRQAPKTLQEFFK